MNCNGFGGGLGGSIGIGSIGGFGQRMPSVGGQSMSGTGTIGQTNVQQVIGDALLRRSGHQGSIGSRISVGRCGPGAGGLGDIAAAADAAYQDADLIVAGGGAAGPGGVVVQNEANKKILGFNNMINELGNAAQQAPRISVGSSGGNSSGR